MYEKELIQVTDPQEEHFVEELNLFTAEDENIPSPELVQAEETIILPEIQSMPAYIRQHYEGEIIRKCAQKIADAELPGEWGKPRNHHSIGGVFVADVRPVKGAITWMSFRRVAECCVEADLTIEMELHFRYGSRGRFKQITQRYFADLWLDMEDGINAEYGNFRLFRHAKDRPGVKLDDYLVPVFSWEDIENEAETIILNTVCEGLTDPKWLQSGLFARRLGLEVVRLPLYKRTKTASILFFKPSEVLMAADDKEELDPIPVPVDGNTIVLNSKKPHHERDAIFHECFHYVEHRLFFQLQQLHNTDVIRLSRWKPVEMRKNERSPIEWMEWQAHAGSQCLQAPQTLLKRKVNEALDGMRQMNRHMGYKLQAVGRALAKEFNVYNYQLRNRMIQVGYCAAKGALNFVGEGYITPFAFSLNECRGRQTFVISPKEMLEEYVRNEAFRARIDTGRFTYVDGHVCLNDPKYVTRLEKTLRLTDWANGHVDQCCLRFVRNYYRDQQTHYVFGQLNSDEAYNGRSLSMSASEQATNLYEQAIKTSRMLLSLPGTFHETFARLMDIGNIRVE